MKYAIITEKHLETRKEKLQNRLDEGYEIVSSVYSGDGYVEYVLRLASHS